MRKKYNLLSKTVLTLYLNSSYVLPLVQSTEKLTAGGRIVTAYLIKYKKKL